MLHPIVRMYSTAGSAAAAVEALKVWGFTDDMITVVGPGQHASDEALVSALTKGFVERSQARHYAAGVRAGQTALVVRAPFSHGEAAQYYMNAAGPVSTQDAFREPFVGAWDDAAPFSSTFRLPVVIEFRPFGGIPCVTRKGSTLGSKLGLPELTDGRPTTEALGLPMLAKSGPALRAIFKG